MALFRRRSAPAPVPVDMTNTAPLVRLDGTRKEAIETGRNRLVVAGMMFAVGFAVLSFRLVQLTLLPEAEPRAARVVPLEPPERVPMDRQSIADRNGLLLATNLKTASLFAEPRKVIDPAVAAARLVQELPGLSEADVRAKLTSGKSFVWLQRNLTPRQQYAVNRLGVPGLHFQYEQRRVYPQGFLAGHVIGFTDVDGRGIAGIEQYFDEQMRDPARAGEVLALSIDARVQHAVRDELLNAMTTFNAIGAGGIVLDVHTGEIIAMVSLPDFDPANPGTASADTRFNRATLGVFEMGSTMKTLTTAMALDAGTVNMAGGYDARHPIKVGRFTIKDDHPKSRWLNVPEIFMYSSNIASAKMALDVGAAGQRAFMDRLGLLRKLTVELPEVGTPLVPRQWKQVETMTIAFGHGLSISPLHLASAVSAVVNGGVLHPPTLLKRDPALPAPGQQVISPRVSENMRKLLALVVEEGTGRKAAVPGYLVGGKTGTAEKVGASGGYNRKANLTTFIAAFPMTAPRYVVLAMLDEPKGSKATYGFASAGWNAAPTAGRVIARIAPLLGLPPLDESSPEVRQAMFVNIPGRVEKKLASH
jgi:cell division protein FtsI (penicillin-binding protein 3)